MYLLQISLLVFFVIDGHVNQHAVANVNAVVLSDQRAEAAEEKKGLHKRVTHIKGRGTMREDKEKSRRCEEQTNSE